MVKALHTFFYDISWSDVARLPCGLTLTLSEILFDHKSLVAMFLGR